MQKIRVIENPEFTQAYGRIPVQQRARVTVEMNNGERRMAEPEGSLDDLASPKTNDQISEKFRGLTEDVLGRKRVDALLDRLWHLEDIENVAEIPAAFVFD